MKIEEKNIYLITVVFLLLASYFSVGYYQFDEHFQILEFAGSKLGLTSVKDLPWEYHEQIRPSIQPVIVIVLYKFVDLIYTANPFTIAFILRILSAFLSFISMVMIYKVFRKKDDSSILNKWFLLFSFLIWFAVFNNVRFSSENWSGTIFVIAFSLYFLKKKKAFHSFFNIGMLLGLAFIIRFQVGFLIAGFLLWMMIIKKEKPINISYITIGLLVAIVFGILLDKWLYGDWTFTAWNYLEQNIIQNKVSSFGVSPWWYYIETFSIQAIPPFSILFIISIIIFIIYDRKSPITWSMVPFLFIHFFIGHKELRFLFPLIGFLPIIVIRSVEILKEKAIIDLTINKPFRVFIKSFFVINSILLLVITFRPADDQIGLYESVYDNYSDSTTLFYFEKNPYHRVLDVKFYKRANLNIKQVDGLKTINDVNSTSTKLITFTNKNIPSDLSDNYRLVYSTIPTWLAKLNYNDWQDKIDIWYVYEFIDTSQNK